MNCKKASTKTAACHYVPPNESWNNEMNECMGTGWEEKLLSIV